MAVLLSSLYRPRKPPAPTSALTIRRFPKTRPDQTWSEPKTQKPSATTSNHLQPPQCQKTHFKRVAHRVGTFFQHCTSISMLFFSSLHIQKATCAWLDFLSFGCVWLVRNELWLTGTRFKMLLFCEPEAWEDFCCCWAQTVKFAENLTFVDLNIHADDFNIA